MKVRLRNIKHWSRTNRSLKPHYYRCDFTFCIDDQRGHLETLWGAMLTSRRYSPKLNRIAKPSVGNIQSLVRRNCYGSFIRKPQLGKEVEGDI